MLDKHYLSALYQFMWVAKMGSFTAAADKLNTSQAAVSRSIKELEHHLEMKLLQRTTRRLSLTHAGENLYQTALESFYQLEKSLNRLEDLRQSPKGTVRISASRHVIDRILLPKLAPLMNDYPDIQLALIEDNRFVDIIDERFDAGVRLGSAVGDGMVAVRISPKIKMAAVATPEFFKRYGFPKKPEDLKKFPCLAYQFQTGRIYDWELEDKGRIVHHTPQNSWVFNDSVTLMNAAKLGIGLAYEPEDIVSKELENRQLIRVLQEYSKSLSSFYLYYPDRQISPALRVVVEKLREEADA
ncbi:LysR family transcriptional regulator [Basilea psittacipulmonis]|uniref:LysR family transcriptional regulator n=1 Tax=Basilea psittacipulmonis DSM 24701 TaxID=1072685 RepID=A0A077DHE6_9BURK|nr:LysR family transcriptional regulator [Basilea psittacipulmonis]AIL32947.1 LysR family transcriptional regulator [Basilea psittacipulmonis DSM 24701]